MHNRLTWENTGFIDAVRDGMRSLIFPPISRSVASEASRPTGPAAAVASSDFELAAQQVLKAFAVAKHDHEVHLANT